MKNFIKKTALVILLAFSRNLAAAEDQKAFFWEMTDESGKRTFLMGSIHLGIEEMYPLPDKVMRSFDASEVLVLEINMNDVDPAALMQKAMFQDGRTLESTLSKEHFEYFQKAFGEFGLTKTYYNKFKPWFAAMFASSMTMKEEGYSEQLGTDMYFLEKANNRRMKVDQLESMESQIDIFESMPDSLSDYYIDYMLKSITQDTNQTEMLFSAYKSGDEKQIESIIIGDDLSSDPNLKYISDKLIVERNYKMAKRILELHSSEKVHFIIAGAAHFVGEEGIINILKKSKKYKIERK